MARRRKRQSDNGGFLVAAGVVFGVIWVWSQPWGPILIVLLIAAAILGGGFYLTTLPEKRRQRMLRLATLQGLLDLTPTQFEHEVARLLTAMGFSGVKVSGGAGDLQADIMARDVDGRLTVVQCKRYAPTRKIGSPVIQSFIGMARVHHGCDRAMFVTTGNFTEPARQLAAQHGIELMAGTDIVELFTQRAALAA